MNVAVIPARGGSKRIPRKNVRDFCGKPMIAWSIEAALTSDCFERVVVSTDDAEIAEIARAWGAETPFLRPPELSDDYTPTRPVINHAIREIEALYGRPQYVCCIYATAPFVRVSDLRNGYSSLTKNKADFAFAVTSFAYPIQRALKRTENGGVAMFYPEHRLTRSQDLETAYHDAGQFYWGKTEAFLADLPTFSSSSIPIILPRRRVHDIDTEEDWLLAELMFNTLNSRIASENA
jgi:pseudaminic acid cytidylyltransferase